MNLNPRNMEICDKQRFEVMPTPDKMCKRDKKEYKVIRLRNGLTACLISDMNHITSSEEVEVKFAAAGLCVGVGSFHNPQEFQGLAHLVEHMVFMGSKKYPNENDFEAFIQQNGGNTNGFTTLQNTNFYFNCFEESFENCLDRFAQCFITPLMRKESIQREIHAVDNEFKGKIDIDSCRAEQILFSLAEQSTHINQNFSCGNLISIIANRDIDALYNYLHKFHKMYYTADRMTLVLWAGLPFHVLEQYVVDKFSDINTSNGFTEINLDLLYNERVFDTPQFKKIIYIKTTSTLYRVNLTWMLPPQMQLYKSKPTQQIIYCLESEEPNGLCHYLKTKKSWAQYIYCYCDEFSSSIFSKFSIKLFLTKEGFKNLDKVIEVIFGYLKMLKNLLPDENLFKYQQTEIEHNWSNKQFSYEDIDDLTSQMQISQPKDFFTGKYFLIEYNPKEIISTLLYLIPEKMNLMILSSTVPKTITYDQVERWYSTKYTVRDFPSQWMEKWESAKPKGKFGLPSMDHQFLPDDRLPDLPEELFPDDDSSDKLPELVLDTPIVQLWHKRDNKFKSLEGYYFYYLIIPPAIKDIKSACLLDILIHILRIKVKNIQCRNGPLCDFRADKKGIVMRFVGCCKQTPIMIMKVMKYFADLCNNSQDQDFESNKEKQNEVYKSLATYDDLSEVLLNAMLVKPYFTTFEKLDILGELTLDDMVPFCKDLLKNMYIKSFVQGNVDVTSARVITDEVIKTLQCKPIKTEEYPQFTIYEIPNGEHCFRTKSSNQETPLSIITNYYQIGAATPKNCAIADIIEILIKEPLYATLRTKEQLAYNLLIDVHKVHNNLLMVITVHSKFSPEYINTKIESFLFQQYNEFKMNGLDKFREAKIYLLKCMKHPDESLCDEVLAHWNNLFNRDSHITYFEEKIKASEQLQYQDVEKIWHDCFTLNENKTFKKISCQILSHIEPESSQDFTN